MLDAQFLQLHFAMIEHCVCVQSWYVLHVLVYRSSPLFVCTADQSKAKFADKVAVNMLNTTTGGGRGFVDMACGVERTDGQ